MEVKNITATVDESTGRITQYRAGVKVAFRIEH
jgi:flavin-binding protein dodecin